MYDELKEFSELKNPHLIDFSNKKEWSWSFKYDGNKGVICHFPKFPEVTNKQESELYCVAYKVPPFMAIIITQIRDTALYDLKKQIIDIDKQQVDLEKKRLSVLTLNTVNPNYKL
jgi:hypothetical protein